MSRRSGLRTERHTVRASDGRQIVFLNTTFGSAEELLGEIERSVYPRLRQESLRAFDEGKAVVFGPFSLDGDGIRAGDEPRVPWQDVTSTAIEDGSLFLRGAGASAITDRRLSLIPNAAILIEMISLASELATKGDPSAPPSRGSL